MIGAGIEALGMFRFAPTRYPIIVKTGTDIQPFLTIEPRAPAPRQLGLDRAICASYVT